VLPLQDNTLEDACVPAAGPTGPPSVVDHLRKLPGPGSVSMSSNPNRAAELVSTRAVPVVPKARAYISALREVIRKYA
jgi:hypothetical protein